MVEHRRSTPCADQAMVKQCSETMTDVPARHKTLAAGRWQTLSLDEQLGNVGTEVGRALRAKEQGNDGRMHGALKRALELIDLTVADPHLGDGRRREVLRARGVVCDFLIGENLYHSTPESVDRYFLAFALAARANR